jgi:hypothetical protein
VSGPQILVCTAGSVTVRSNGRELTLTPGRSIFVTAEAGPLVLGGTGDVFRGPRVRSAEVLSLLPAGGPILRETRASQPGLSGGVMGNRTARGYRSVLGVGLAGLVATAVVVPPASAVAGPVTAGPVIAGPVTAADPATDWVRVEPPRGLEAGAELFGVSSPDRANAWAVGSEGGRPLVLRRHGGHWSKVALPAITWGGELRRVAAVSRRDVWATGTDVQGVARILHWNGRTWRETTFPGSADPSTAIYTMAGSPGHRPWLLVASAEGKFLLRRTATGWARVSVPAPPFDTVTLNVALDGRLWVAGTETAADGFTPIVRLYRWSRGALRPVPTTGSSPAVQPNDVVPGPTGVWLGASNAYDGSSAIVGWTGRAWRETPFAQPTFGAVSVTADAWGRPAWALHGSIDNGSTPVYLKNVRGTWVAMPGAPAVAPEVGPADISGFTAVPGTRCSLAVGRIALVTGSFAPRIEQECS